MCRRTQTGFTLAEVLASLFLLAVGIIGAAGMQLHALRTAQHSAFHTTALSLATEMADMMRLTLSSADSHERLKPYLGIDFRSGESMLNDVQTCYRSPCDAERLTEFSIEQWKQRIENSLPTARATICVDAQSESGGDQPEWNCRPPGLKDGGIQGAIVVKIGWQDKTVLPARDKFSGQASDFPPRLVMTVAPYVQ